MSRLEAVAHPDARTFLRRAEGWLMRREDENNLALGLASALGDAPPQEGSHGYLFATVEVDGEVAGCGDTPTPRASATCTRPGGCGAGSTPGRSRRR